MPEGSSSRDVIVAGVGNLLLRDDGVGVHAVRALERENYREAALLDIGTAVLHGADLLDGANRILVVDAVQHGGPPGARYLFRAEESEEGGALMSLHSLGLRSALSLVPGGAPHVEILVLGVEPSDLSYGMELSPAVAAVLLDVTATVRGLVTRWRRTAPGPGFLEEYNSVLAGASCAGETICRANESGSGCRRRWRGSWERAPGPKPRARWTSA